MDDLENLYRQVIMEHYKHPHHKGLVDDESYVKVHYNNPSCGDDIYVQIKITDDKIIDIRHEGKGCSICCSSASVMSDLLIGKTIIEATDLLNNFLQMIKGEAFDEKLDLMDAYAYQGVSKFPARIKCATLAWKAFEKGIKERK